MSEKAEFEAEVKAVEEFQKVSPSSSSRPQLMISNPGSPGLYDHIPPLMSFQRGVLYLYLILPM